MYLDPTIAKHYAQAVFNLAQERGELDRLERDAELFEAVYNAEKNAKVRRFLESPVYLTKDKEALVRKAFAQDLAPMLVNVLVMLVRRGRTIFAPAIMARVHQLVAEAKGIVDGTVTTAVALNEGERDRLLASLKKMAGAGLRLRYRVDPTILGGVIVKYQDTLIDDSVRARLDKMRSRLAALDLRAPAAKA